MAEIWEHAADVVADWFLLRKVPRDAIADRRELRSLATAERAAISSLAHTALAQQRRLEVLAGGAQGLPQLAPYVRATVLVLASLVDRQQLLADSASRAAERRLQRPFDFAPVLAGAERFASIADPVARFGACWSLPDWLAGRLLAEFGDEAATVVRALNEPAPRTLRANTLRVASRDELARSLQAQGIGTRLAAHAPHGLHVDGDADLFATALYQNGAFEQQDEASQLAALAVAPPPRGRVLDLCAGSGGKTLAVAAALQNRGEVLATDVHDGRLQALRQRARRAGVTNVRALQIGEHEWPAAVEEFARTADRILIDAPCSGTGSWRRHPEGRWTLTAADLAALLHTQDRLLDRVAGVLQPGARLVYATCSVLAAENELRVAALLQRRPELEVVRLAEVLGGAVARPIADAKGAFLSLRPDRQGCDGFFAAILRRRR